MKADITRRTFDPAKHYAAVMFGQGQVQVDADLNEQQEIGRYRTETLGADVVGPTGVPKADNGFEVTVAPDGRDLLVSPGRIYVDGILCENAPQIAPASVVGATEIRPSVGAPDGRGYAAGQWVEVFIAGTPHMVQVAAVDPNGSLKLASTPAGLPAAGSTVDIRRVTSYRSQPDRFVADPFDPANPDHLVANAYRIELDVWHRHMGRVEDPSIGDVALGDAESASRVRVVWQLRLVQAGPVGAGSCAVTQAGEPGRLRASTVPGLPVDDPCELPDEAGYRGLEHQLYRVEVHDVTTTGVVLKWQRDNGFAASRLTAIGSTIVVQDMGRDSELGLTQAKFVEVTDDALELEQQPSDLLAVTATDPVTRAITLAAAPTKAVLSRAARARRWDGRIAITFGTPGAADPFVLERGLQVALEPGVLRPGDYWMIPARTVTSSGGGTLYWLRDDKGVALSKVPDGIRHHRAALAVVDCDGGGFLTTAGGRRECRPRFPALTALTAADVSIDPSSCGFVGVATVQQAIDELCGRRGSGVCTVTATPGPGWEKVFADIPAGKPGHICFPVGEYPVTAKVTVANKGHLVLAGAGFGAVLSAATAETVLEFTGCASVSVRDLAVSAAGTALGPTLAGALSFTGCPEVNVESTLVTVVGRPVPGASCVRVSGAGVDVRVQRCRFEVGDRQVGVLLLDVARAAVVDNTIRAAGAPATGATLAGLTKPERDMARRTLFADLRMIPVSGKRVAVTIAGRPWSFATSGPGTTAWPPLLTGPFPQMRDLQHRVDKVLRSLFTQAPVAGSAALVTFLTDRVVGRRVSAMYQGIVVAGATASDVRLEGNAILGAIQGVHAAVSHGTGKGAAPDSLDRVVVERNRISVVVPPSEMGGRHGVYVGNAQAIQVTGNQLSYDSRVDDDRIVTDGIRLYGYLGRQVIVRDNLLDGFPGGISVTAASKVPPSPRVWTAEDNVLSGARSPFIRTGGVAGSQLTFRGNKPGPLDTLDPRYQLKPA
jgi:hypothetical protein